MMLGTVVSGWRCYSCIGIQCLWVNGACVAHLLDDSKQKTDMSVFTSVHTSVHVCARACVHISEHICAQGLSVHICLCTCMRTSYVHVCALACHAHICTRACANVLGTCTCLCTCCLHVSMHMVVCTSFYLSVHAFVRYFLKVPKVHSTIAIVPLP